MRKTIRFGIIYCEKVLIAGAFLRLLTDRPQGASSRAAGEVEVVIQRQTSSEDGQGMGEELIQKGITR